MQRLIRKILREDDFDFIEDGYSLDGIKFTHRDDPNLIYTIVDDGGYNITITWGSTLLGTVTYQRNRVEALFHNGEWIIYDTINEDHDMDWIENTNPVPLGEWDKPRKGEHLVCLPGFSNSPHTKKAGVPALPYGGAGYVEGRVITVRRVSGSPIQGYIIWPELHSDGIYSFALARI